MSEIKALEKLRKSSHIDDDKWMLENGDVVYIYNGLPDDSNAVNFGEQWRKIADEIEAEIAERFMELPLDADGVPIHLGDLLVRGNDDKHFCRAIGKSSPDIMDEHCNWWRSESFRHVKPRTVEDVLEDFLADYDDREKMRAELFKRYADEIRELLGSDVE